ncbi:MAG: class I SAM-dependent methyltransferase [Raoultibacter sp.]
MKTIDQSFIHENLMGPNVALLFDELCRGELPPDAGSRICDLGCGAGLSSLLAAETTHGTVSAVDSWNTPEKNRERFDAFDCGSRIKAIQADAPDLPFEQHYFDALFSLDSYNYFGCGLGIIDKPHEML